MPLVFCYGTLAFPEIMTTVTGRHFPAVAATLGGYARYCVKNAIYPAIVVEAGAQTEGTLYCDIDPVSLRRLDRYEDSIYVRRTVNVRTVDGAIRAAQTYIVPAQRRWILSARPWDKMHFARHHLKAYLAQIGK